MTKTTNLIAVCLILMFMSGTGTAGETIVICGTGDSQKLLRVLAKAFEKSHRGTTIEVPDSIGSSGGVRATANGKCAIGRIARPIKDKEKKYNLNHKLFALSPVVIITSKSVERVSGLTSEQLVNIYSGKIVNWSEVGGKDAKIYLANREAGDSSRIILEKHIQGFKEIQDLAGRVIYSTPETVEIIAGNDDTIGYIPLAMAKHSNIKIMELNGVFPSASNIQEGKYKLVAPFGLVWRGELKGMALAFFEYLFDPEARKLIADNGAFPAQ